MLSLVFSGFVNGFFALALGAFVYFKNRKSKPCQLFLLLNTALALWAFSLGIWQISEDREFSLFWIRMASLGMIFIPVFFLHWTIAFLEPYRRKNKLLFAGYLLTTLFAISAFTPFYFENLKFDIDFLWLPEIGILYPLYVLLIYFGLSAYNFYLLAKSYQSAFGVRREQIQYITMAALLGLGGLFTNILLWSGIHLFAFGVFFVPFFTIFLGYAIALYPLADTKVAVGRAVIYIFTFLIIVGLAIFLTFLNENLTVSLPNYWLTVLIGGIIILFFPYLFRFFERTASKYFYYSFYSSQTVLRGLGEKLTKVLELDKFTLLIAETLTETFKLRKIGIVLLDKESGLYQTHRIIGFKEGECLALVKNNLIIYLQEIKKPLIGEELDLVLSQSQNREEKETLMKMKVSLQIIEAQMCLPLFFEEKVVGVIILGKKISGDSFYKEDIELLADLANQASVALENARLYNQAEKFSASLEKRVAEQTRELRKAYEELKKLDQAKSEFISIASHQLRTPLGVIKGYLSLILEGSYGRISKKIKEKIGRVYLSNERLLRVVSELLNVSRIETGKLEVRPEKAQIEDIIKNAVEELADEAKKRGISLKFQPPKTVLPSVLVDKDKIEEAVFNIIDNAIKYTPIGGVKIKATAEDSKLKIIISDTGVGMTKEEAENIFNKFSRGTAGIALHTEGVGLGLYIAKRFVELHNGKIWSESEGKDMGSTFFIELPIA